MPVDVEYLDGIPQLVVVAVEVEAMLHFLPVQGHGDFTVGHPRLDRAGDDRVERAKIVVAVREPGIDDIGIADILGAHAAVRFPRLLERLPDPLRRPAVPPVHRPLLDDLVFRLPGLDLLHMPPWDVGRMMIARPRSEPVIGPGQR